MMILELSNILDEMRSNNGSDVSRLSQLDISFHFTIATASNNSLLKNTLVAVSNELERSSYSGYSLDPKTTISQLAGFPSANSGGHPRATTRKRPAGPCATTSKTSIPS